MSASVLTVDVGRRTFDVPLQVAERDRDAISEDLWLRHRFSWAATQSKENLFRQFHGAMEPLTAHERSVQQMMYAIATAGGFSPAPIPPLRHEGQRSLYEVAELPVAALGEELLRLFDERCRALARHVVESLAAGLQQNQVGLIRFSELDPKVCQFFYCRLTTSLNSWTVERMRHHREVDTLWAYLHDLVEAEAVPVAWYSGEVPQRVQQVIEALPPFIAPHCKIVSGTLIGETIVERQVAVREWSEVLPETPRYAGDPALVFGPFVLAGWEESEAPMTPVRRIR